MRKYLSYTLCTDTKSVVFYTYDAAFCAYQKRSKSATLYGHTIDGDMCLILSK
jgi:hypothetical protein